MADDLDARLLRDALDALPEALAVFDSDGRLVFGNGAFRRVEPAAAAAGPGPAWREHGFGGGHRLRVGLACSDGTARPDGRVSQAHGCGALPLLDADPAPILVCDADSRRVLWVNEAAARFYGRGRDAFLALTIGDLRADPEPADAPIPETRAPDPDAGTRLHRTASGERRIVRVTVSLMALEGRDALLVAVTDMTEQHRLQEEARRAHDFLRQVIDQVPSAVSAKDMADGGRYVIYNRATEALFGRSRRDTLGRTAREVFDAEQADIFERQDVTALRLGLVEAVEDEVIRRPDGSTRHVRARKVALADGQDERPRFVIGVFEDVTDRRASEARIAHMAHHDGLTDLPNRFLFRDRLASALARARDARDAFAVLCVDLDGFKAVNDAWGHATGDRLLQAVADRLRGALRSCDTAARFGGDEFAVLQAPIAGADDAAQLAERLIASLAAPCAVDGRDLAVSASVGIALAQGHDADAAELMQRADEALYRAKREGRNRFRFADPAPDADASRLRAAAARMRQADGGWASPPAAARRDASGGPAR